MPAGDGEMMGLYEAVEVIVRRLQAQPASGASGGDCWGRIVSIIAEHDALPWANQRQCLLRQAHVLALAAVMA